MRDCLDIDHAYEILGLKAGVSQIEIKRAYRQLVKIWHPDRFTNPQQKQQAEVKIKQINAAYNLLKSEYPPATQPKTVSVGQQKKSKVSAHRWDAETFYNYGLESVAQGEYQQAIAYFTQAIRLNPHYVAAYKSRGLVCSQLGYEYRATSDLNKAAQLEGKIPKSASFSRIKYKSQPRNLITKLCQNIKKFLKLY
ncbi:DnaJ-class molecular chaperone with C-terminal Zn finger domain [Nostoc sp. PCC 7524]|uniref:J domain-containing protein n=1 Tax=Nostoc sp. (strain ATCC 29411 / PCC 7524) TaxID=28072 RepID=UPI00029F417E|nr:DnaJ domain-containing protein [Nostoc sp. PCC 7524]AFY49230.1 DnaJ-class molecular chaperone with C-terminal Zn finger domain [Nostoc sp. PCC 7524]